MPKIFDALRRRQFDRRLIEFDTSNLLQRYGQDAEGRALQFETQGADMLFAGRPEGHWRRVAKCIASRPAPTRQSEVFG